MQHRFDVSATAKSFVSGRSEDDAVVGLGSDCAQCCRDSVAHGGGEGVKLLRPVQVDLQHAGFVRYGDVRR